MEIKISELVPSAATRTRGAEAIQALKERIRGQELTELVIDFSGIRIMPGSFVDEVTYQSQQIQQETGIRIIYRIDTDVTLGKLAWSAGLRGLERSYLRQNSNEPIHLESAPLGEPEWNAQMEEIMTT
ncbi:MAG TPA: hypothetical protein PLQ35_03875 [bacterium]|nr:hypothetical protein [bacterium]HQL61410.1 hypothetical protein [bacterium]